MSTLLTTFEEKGTLPVPLLNCAVDALDEDFREQQKQPHIAILKFHDLAGQFGQFGNAQQLPTLIVDDQPVLQPIEGDPSAVACPRQHLTLSPVLQIKQFCVDSRRCVPYRLDAIRRAKTSAPSSAAAVAAQAAQSNSGTRGLGLSIAAISRKGFAPGYKEDNQDRCMVVQPFAGANQVLIGVMDGHGVDGHRVSEYVKSSLPGVLRGHLLIGGQTPRKAYVNAFHEVDSLLSTSSGIDAENSGSTAVLGLLQGKQLTTAWVGDSRGVVGVFNWPY
ncbi:phosphatase 2C-like domain-containing protein [Dunaliella salina]|uniref:Phosphatase 2C-like domain-containing protein n=1 Tax=Dunaliella salina TaxID=3046 RepID=A0ABQ7G7P0_DUNSA|nr:phosphatase 2C-like domain-containing protein [Dunaliella salina]|eukprot:KAF5830623.1 phosphatase 2C-like domain-containing protein [Dunaliella salina]